MGRRTTVNWAFIEPLFRMGRMSLPEIVDRYNEYHKSSDTFKPTVSVGGIKKHAAKYQWTRDMSAAVKEKIKEQIIAGNIKGLNEQALISHAADLGIGVIKRHRAELATLLRHEEQLLKELEERPVKTVTYMRKGEILEKEVKATVADKAVTLKMLAQIRAKRIELERIAYDLNSEAVDDSTISEIKIIRRSKRDGD